LNAQLAHLPTLISNSVRYTAFYLRMSRSHDWWHCQKCAFRLYLRRDAWNWYQA